MDLRSPLQDTVLVGELHHPEAGLQAGVRQTGRTVDQAERHLKLGTHGILTHQDQQPTGSEGVLLLLVL